MVKSLLTTHLPPPAMEQQRWRGAVLRSQWVLGIAEEISFPPGSVLSYSPSKVHPMWDTRYFLLARAAAVHYSGAQRSQMILVSVPQTQREPHLWQLAGLILVASATVAFSFLEQWAWASSQGWILAILFPGMCCDPSQDLNRRVRLQLGIHTIGIQKIISDNRI